jgi:hypothetical protein
VLEIILLPLPEMASSSSFLIKNILGDSQKADEECPMGIKRVGNVKNLQTIREEEEEGLIMNMDGLKLETDEEKEGKLLTEDEKSFKTYNKLEEPLFYSGKVSCTFWTRNQYDLWQAVDIYLNVQLFQFMTAGRHWDQVRAVLPQQERYSWEERIVLPVYYLPTSLKNLKKKPRKIKCHLGVIFDCWDIWMTRSTQYIDAEINYWPNGEDDVMQMEGVEVQTVKKRASEEVNFFTIWRHGYGDDWKKQQIGVSHSKHLTF